MFTKDEDLRTTEPTAKLCKRCKNALKDVQIGKIVISRTAYTQCEKYKRKPHDVLWEDADCEMFEAK